MRSLLLSFILLLLISCEIVFPDAITNHINTNPFVSSYDISKPSQDASRIDIGSESNVQEKKLRFVAITDVHIGREKEDDGIEFFNDNFFSYLDSNKPPFVLCLGDLSDNGVYTPELKDFVDNVVSRTRNNWFVYCIGNHERHIFDSDKWYDGDVHDLGWDVKLFSGTMARYCYGNILSIYKMDNSMRIFGQKQLLYLEEAFKQDRAMYKIIVAHDNITSGGVFDQSLVITGFADIQERNHFYRIMDKYGVSLVLTGHHHKGNIEYKLSNDLAELNLAAYHKRSTFLDYESEGYFYECILDIESGVMTINGYLAEDTKDVSRNPDITYSYKLRKAR